MPIKPATGITYTGSALKRVMTSNVMPKTANANAVMPLFHKMTKAAEAIIAVVTTGTSPLHQLLGSDSVGFAEARLRTMR